MSGRVALAAHDLYALLEREFRRRRPPDCESCYVQFPFRVDRKGDEGAPNWEILPAFKCPYHCAVVLEEVASFLGRRYDLAA